MFPSIFMPYLNVTYLYKAQNDSSFCGLGVSSFISNLCSRKERDVILEICLFGIDVFAELSFEF